MHKNCVCLNQVNLELNRENFAIEILSGNNNSVVKNFVRLLKFFYSHDSYIKITKRYYLNNPLCLCKPFYCYDKIITVTKCVQSSVIKK